jgi:hypothetical protein
MNPCGSEKTERGSKRREGKEPSRVPSMSLPEGGGALRGMGEKFAAHPGTGKGSMTAHHRGTSRYLPNLSRHEEHSACGAGWGIDGAAQT